MDKKQEIVDCLRKHWQNILGTLVIVSLLILGIVLLSTCHQLIEKIHVQDYANCTTPNSMPCTEVLEEQDMCPCLVYFKLSSDFLGTVTGYYQLDAFDQSISAYAKSRDNNQLRGNLSLDLSADCGDYRYHNTTEGTKPIAPCGAVADSMFFDSIALLIELNETNKEYVPLVTSGIISKEDKNGFKNPSGNLTQAFRNFTKPKSWTYYVYELDTSSTTNNGFQNEAFIAWMRTDWKLKPLWRVDNTKPGYENGLLGGKYQLRIEYKNPPNRYRGPRKVVIKSELPVLYKARYIIGIIAIVAGLLLAAAYVVARILDRTLWKSRFTRCETAET